MKSIYEQATLQEINSRIDSLSANSHRQWGTMTVAQMLAHCSVPIEIALGDKHARPALISRLFAPFIKKVIVGDKPFKQSLPTDKNFLITDDRDFDKEKTRLKALVHRVSTGGAALMEGKPHAFLGKLTAQEWSTSLYKHLDHHLRQFGV